MDGIREFDTHMPIHPIQNVAWGFIQVFTYPASFVMSAMYAFDCLHCTICSLSLVLDVLREPLARVRVRRRDFQIHGSAYILQ